ncbi:hypothetical protein HBH69_015840 [Parastagonospora nodorum]|nr:hypothetical protein HBI76_106780 [Parastagonospora nodorum]KAH5162827.1 hypothetical protein HBH69_015840 [Parastagonospora nodorum]KAH5232019.1 hypothetical protein HBI62_066640 [Parastagonospora nodorum]KAH5349280.1 hypothetical protein HBI49_195460 [Parastagonospora nodorum]KAH5999891.1 hypothetical protein HBI84_106470 [Parastagonospora nodorum]
MDPLSITANIITVLHVANSIISVCYEVRSAVKQSPWSLTRTIDELRDLRNVLESLETAYNALDRAKSVDETRVRSFRLLCDSEASPLARCLQELSMLERKITKNGRGTPRLFSKAHAITQVIGWQLKENDARLSLERIERCKNTIILALTADETTLLIDIKAMTASLSESTALMNDNVSRILVRIQSSEMGMSLLVHFLYTLTDVDHKSRAITRWLAPINPWESHNAAVASRQPDTGGWLIQSKAFQNWSMSKSGGLWLSGFPGSGKTILFANVILSLQDQITRSPQRTVAAFFYCDFRQRESQDPINILGSLAAQICYQSESYPSELELAFQHSLHSGKRPSIALLRDALCALSVSARIVLLVDAIDECSERQELLSTFNYLLDMSANITILLTSRHELDIQDALVPFEHVRIEDWIKEIDEDIETYINYRLESDLRLSRLKPSIKDEVRDSIHGKSHGMFRLVQCSLDGVSALRTVRDIRTALQHIPHELGQTYENILVRVSAADAAIVRKILLWLCFTMLPITLDELHSAIAIEHGLDELDEDSCLSSAQEIVAVCGCLITVSTTGYVRLAHLSVKDYLLSEGIRNGPASSFALGQLAGNCELALDCFTYLSYGSFRSGPSCSEEDFALRLKNYPFLRHAATTWTYYLRATEVAGEPSIQLDEKILSFFSPETSRAFMSWVQVLNAGSSSGGSSWTSYPKHATTLYYAASFSLLEVTQHLIEAGVDLNTPASRYGGTALHGAVCRNHIPIVRALLEAGADAGQSDWDKVTPLHTAAVEGYVDCAILLLQYGADRNALDKAGEKPIDWAIKGEQECQKILETKLGMLDADMVGPLLADLKFRRKIAANASEVKVWAGWDGKYIPEWSK